MNVSDALSAELKLHLFAKRYIDDIWHFQFKGLKTSSHPLVEKLQCEDLFYDTSAVTEVNLVSDDVRQHTQYADAADCSKGIYPVELVGPSGPISMPLELSLQDAGTVVPMLDVRVRLMEQGPNKRRLQWSHYDKRRGKPAFAGTKTFPDFESVLSECCKYGTLTGALDRFNRATSTRSAFQRVATRQVIAMHRYGYSPRKLLARLHHYSRVSPSKGRYSQSVDAITRMVHAWIARNDAANDADH